MGYLIRGFRASLIIVSITAALTILRALLAGTHQRSGFVILILLSELVFLTPVAAFAILFQEHLPKRNSN
jgi:hypothetical protein